MNRHCILCVCKNILRAAENMGPRKIFGPNAEEVTKCRKLQKEELRNLCSLCNMINVINSGRVISVGLV
jgi:hypothetical protein